MFHIKVSHTSSSSSAFSLSNTGSRASTHSRQPIANGFLLLWFLARLFTLSTSQWQEVNEGNRCRPSSFSAPDPTWQHWSLFCTKTTFNVKFLFLGKNSFLLFGPRPNYKRDRCVRGNLLQEAAKKKSCRKEKYYDRTPFVDASHSSAHSKAHIRSGWRERWKVECIYRLVCYLMNTPLISAVWHWLCITESQICYFLIVKMAAVRHQWVV